MLASERKKIIINKSGNKGNFPCIKWLINQAEIKEKNEEFKEAIAFYLEVIELDDNQPVRLYEKTINLLAKVNGINQALNLGKKALIIYPQSKEIDQAIKKISEKQQEDILEVTEQSIAQKIDYLHTQAVAKHQEGKLEEAIIFYLKAIELDDNQPAWVYGNTITLLSEVSSLDKGLELGEKAEKLYPESDEIYRAIGLVYFKMGNLRENANFYQRAISLKQEQPNWLYAHLIDNLILQNSIDQAISIGNLGRKLHPEDHWITHHLNYALSIKDDEEQAKKTYPKNANFDDLNYNHESQFKDYSAQIEAQAINQDVRLIAFYLPQFHPIPENDQWWGKGFTEWMNVARAKPYFEGHYQPHLPADLGFYDLRLDEVREAQAKLAKNYGIHGFCYYYYWFNGKRLLERPLEGILQSQKPDFPFCICWANENWTRSWDGREKDILVAQEYTTESLKAFAESVVPYLLDKRYIKVNGRPLLLIYRIGHIPNPSETIAQWREVFLEQGVGEVHIAGVIGFGLKNPVSLGCDSGVQFPPNSLRTQTVLPSGLEDQDFSGHIYNYEYAIQQSLEEKLPDYPCFPGVMPSWDNTARRKEQGTVWLNSSPEKYQVWLKGAITKIENKDKDEQIVFINAWNEWAEGAHLEPDQKYGHAYLNATKAALLTQSDWKTLIQVLKNLAVEDVNILKKLLCELEVAIEKENPSYQDLIQYLATGAIIVEEIKKIEIDISQDDELKIFSHLESPETTQQIAEKESLNVNGWVISYPYHPVAVELIHNDVLLKQIPINISRSDVASGHPDYKGKYHGFATELNLDKYKLFSDHDTIDIDVKVILSNSSSQLLDKLTIKQNKFIFLLQHQKNPILNSTASRIISNLEKRFKAKPTLFILHDIASAGAQLFLVRLLEWIHINQPDLRIEVLINISREQIAHYGKQGELILERLNNCGKVNFTDSQNNLPENIHKIQNGKYSCVYVNTCTLGNLLESIGQIETPIIVHVHELNFWIKHRLGLDNFNRLLNFNPHFIACSNAVKDNLINICKVPSQQIEVVHAFVPTDSLIQSRTKTKQQVRQELGIGKDTFVVVSCGTLDWRKGADLLIPLVVLLKEKMPTNNFVCLWIGGWQNKLSESEMKFAIEKAGIENNLLLTGHKQDPINYLGAGNMFMLLSREDPFPLVMSEAGICKLPVVGFERSGGVTEFVENEAGFTVPYLNLNAMANQIINLYKNPDKVQKMGKNAYKKVCNLYSENILAPKILDRINYVSSEVREYSSAE